MLRNKYKFYLAFENSWCEDYVTEKFFRSLNNDVVPVVLAPKEVVNYSILAPPNSYINALDFDSAKQLADYLKLLDARDDLYARYFDWKAYYKVLKPDTRGWCDLCRMAKDRTRQPKTYADIKQWWIGKGECLNSSLAYF